MSNNKSLPGSPALCLPAVGRCEELYSTEVDLFTHSSLVAAPLAKNLMTAPIEPELTKTPRLIDLTCQALPLKWEQCTWKMELSLIISRTVIIRVKRSSKYSDIYTVHREDGVGRFPWATA